MQDLHGQEYEVLKQLIYNAKQVNLTMCIDNLETNTNPDKDIYYSNKQTLKKVLRLVKENGLKLEEPTFLDTVYRFKNNELIHLSENINNIKIKIYNQNVENIKIFLAKNPYSEIEQVAKQIVKLIRNENIRYKDIAIITKNIDEYSSLARSIFNRYEIPIFIDEKRDLNQNIIIQYTLSILEILNKNFTQDSIFYYLKLGFCDIDKDEIFKLENYCIKWGIKQNKWKKEFTYEKDEKEQEIERFNELRKEIVNPLLNLKTKIDKQKTAKNISRCIYEFMQEQKIEQKIKLKIEKLREKGLFELAEEYIQSYKIILEILDEIVLTYAEDKLSLDQYSKILKVGMQNSGLGKIPGTQDQVTLADTERSRSSKVKIVFLIGVNDGQFPSINKDEGFFNDEDRETLKQEGLEIAKGTIENLYEENFNIHKAFTTAEEKIYISYCSSDKEGKSLRPSIYINKLKKIYPKIEEKSDVVNKTYEIVNEEITYEELLENIAKLNEKEKIEDIWYQVYKYYKEKIKWNDTLNKDLKALFYTNQPKKIEKDNIQKLYGNILKTSISKLEKYRQCPFSYFMQYGLKLKEKEELKIHTFDTGTFMHETIDQFFDQVRENKQTLSELEEKDIEKIVSQIIDDKLEDGKNYIFKATVKYKVLVRRLKRIVSKALKYIINTIIYSDFSIEGTEIEFGVKGKYKPIILELENGKTIEITGKIDRIDTAKEDDGKYLRIIDYKSSSKNIDLNEVYAGLQIQLLTYIDAICKEEDIIPAGMFYFSLLEQMVKADKKITEEQIEQQIQKNFKMKGLILADVKIIKMNDNSLVSGSSKLVPAAITQSGTVNQKWTNGVTSEEFKILQDYINITIKEIAKEILNGNVEIKPFNKKGKTPCEYCNYRTICGFNPQNKDNCYNYITQKPKDEIIEKMKNKEKQI